MTGPQRRVRPPAVAGTFYPAGPNGLREAIEWSFDHAVDGPRSPTPRAVIVPHAGYIYSGPIAATAYARLRQAAPRVRRVVLLGPAHYVPVRGIALSSADAWQTPLGPVELDAGHRQTLERFPWVRVDDAAHAPEHSLEVQLPFLQTVLEDFTLVPLLVGETTTEEVTAVVEELWSDPATLVVVSTDLSHYHRYGDATARDERTAAAITSMTGDVIEPEDACGSRPLRGLLEAAAGHGMAVEQLDLRNSGDTSGDRNRVVGYGAFAVA